MNAGKFLKRQNRSCRRSAARPYHIWSNFSKIVHVITVGAPQLACKAWEEQPLTQFPFSSEHLTILSGKRANRHAVRSVVLGHVKRFQACFERSMAWELSALRRKL